MNLPPLHLVDGALLVSPTQLDDMRRCFQYWGYRHVHRRIPNAPAPERDCGKAGHAGLEALVRARLRGLPEEQARAQMEEAVLSAFRTIQVPDDEAWRTPVRYVEALRGYCDHWGQEPFETLACEVPFAFELGWIRVDAAHVDMPVILRGIIDRVLRWDDGVAYIGDYKFKNDWGDAAQTQYGRDPQFKLYALALNELQRDRPELGLPGDVGGAVIDAIVLRAPLQRETAKSKPRTEYHRVRYPYHKWQLEETRQQALGWVRMALQQHAEDAFVQNESRCSFFFGKRRCPFLEVCAVPFEQRAVVLGSDYFTDKVERELVVKEEPVDE